MGIFEQMEKHGHEELIFCYNKPTNLKAIIAIHNTTLGNAIGGCRLWRYNSEEEALIDALILSQIMTCQSAIADSDTGGGKVVLWHDFEEAPDEAYFRALGRFIEGLKGRFVTYPDLGTDTQDMRYIKRETDYVLLFGYPTGGAESSEITAYGVYWGMKACAQEVYGHSELDGLTVAIQGVGSVGALLADYLMQEDVKLIITDLNYDRLKKVQDKYPRAQIVKPEKILTAQCDILSPCALGPVFTKENISQLRCKIIAGPAYNILEDISLAEELHKRGILCAPDFVINAGEMFLTEDQFKILSKEQALTAVKKIYDIMAKIIAKSKREKISPYQAAHKLSQERIQRVGAIKDILTRPEIFSGKRKP
jgi:leucine dehydrogenase